jgi:hypothetical protein
VTWPPPRPDKQPIEDRPWDPGHPRERSLHEESERLVYVVVDEIIENWVGLSFAPWPHADDDGRLRFPEEEGPIEVGTSREALDRFLATEERGGGKKRRGTAGKVEQEEGEPGVRIGMTFGARVKRGKADRMLKRLRDQAALGEVRIDDLKTILTRPVDLTEEGRLLAKLATYGAMLSTLPREVGKKWRLTRVKEE